MLKRILVALDPSPESNHAQDQAIHLASSHNASILGLAVVDEPGITRPEPVPPGAAEFHKQKVHSLLQRGEERAHELLKHFQSRCEKAGVKVDLESLHGSPADIVVRESYRCDLLLSAPHTFLKHITQDGACDSLHVALKKTPRPAYITPQHHQGEGVLVTVDGSAEAARTLQLFVLLGLCKGKTANVVSVHEDQSHAAENCRMTAHFLRAHGITATESPIASKEPPTEELLDLIQATRPEVVVMGAFGVSGLRDFFFGSVTNRMLERCPAPLFIHR